MCSSDLTEIRTYIQRHEREIAPLYIDYSLKFWDMSLQGNETQEKALIEAKERYVKVYNNEAEFKQIRAWLHAGPDLPEIESRQLKLIHDAFAPNQIPESLLMDIVGRETQIETLFNTFRASFEGEEASDNQLREILKLESNIARRRAAWEASKLVGQAIAPALLEIGRAHV